MDYQGVRQAFEIQLNLAYGALSPAVPIFFDNFGDVTSDADSEFVYINIQFGLTTETALTSSFDQIRGVLNIKVFSEKDKGPARNQTLITTAVDVLETINNGTKGATGTY